MISDVLWEAIEEIREYQAKFPDAYGGELEPRLDKLVADMDAKRIELDTDPDDKRMYLARALDDYMKFRSGREGVAYELNPQFFLVAMYHGVFNFFGIATDRPTGTLIEDVQNPAAFEDWRHGRGKDAA
jgi:hypothetical protein